MRLLLDTCIVFYMIDEDDKLSRDVKAMLSDYDNQLYESMETIKELIVAYRRKGLGRKIWKTEDDIISTIKDELVSQFYLFTRSTYTLMPGLP